MNKPWKIVLALLIALTASISTLGAGTDFTLGIFGNANMDDTIDEKDVAYVEGVIKGTNAATNLSDANYDGKIDNNDIIQIEQIIQGKDKELTILDSGDRILTVKKPVERIAFINTNVAEILSILDSGDRVVGVPSSILDKYRELFPEMADKPNVGGFTDPNYEKILEVNPQILINYPGKAPDLENNLKNTGVNVILLGFDHSGRSFDQEVILLSYILEKRNEADDFINWKEQYRNLIEDRLKSLKDEEKVRVFLSRDSMEYLFQTGTQGTAYHEVVTIAGGNNIAADLGSKQYLNVDPEWVMEQNPAAIMLMGFTATGYQQLNDTEAKAIWENALNQPILNQTDAGKQGRLYVLNHYLATTRLDIGICYVAKWLYPKIFKDLHPEEINREFFERFLHSKYKGVYAYPLPE
ncbi:MAG: ABC transporter substrate-binding protein [Methanothrix sp.]|nr:ABC transporter substrate-binding protein [Methanothrix sp.]